MFIRTWDCYYCKIIASDLEALGELGKTLDERTKLDDVVGVNQLYGEILMTLYVHTTSTDVKSVAFKQNTFTCH